MQIQSGRTVPFSSKFANLIMKKFKIHQTNLAERTSVNGKVRERCFEKCKNYAEFVILS
jgi:hypothetical protein